MSGIPGFTALGWTCLLALLLIRGRAAAAPVAITNPSFESPVRGDGGFSTGSISGWTATGSAAKGVFNPTTVQLVSPTDGAQVGYLDGGGTAVTLAQPFPLRSPRARPTCSRPISPIA